MHHIDVVPADAKYWDVPPLSRKIRDDNIYGRGATDTEGLGIAQLPSFLAPKDCGQKLNREVVFMATADEEASAFYGPGWLLENQPKIFEGAGYQVNEGGSGMLINDTSVFSIEVTREAPLTLRLTATDIPSRCSA